MSLHDAFCLRRFAIAGVLLVLAGTATAQRPTGSSTAEVAGQLNWLEGSGETLKIRLRGEIVDEQGEPLEEANLNASINLLSKRKIALQPTLEQNRFELEVPAHRGDWHSLALSASTADGRKRCYKRVLVYQLRQAAAEGMTLRVQPPSRRIEVTVTHEGRPVAGANVQADFRLGHMAQERTNRSGVCRLPLFPDTSLRSLTAWTDDHRIGGYTLSRRPKRDPEAESHQIELWDGRDQKIRVINQDGSPVAGVHLRVPVATPAPNYNYLGDIEPLRRTTDENGEATIRCLPDVGDVHAYVELHDENWGIAGDSKQIDENPVVTVKTKTRRKRIMGEIQGPDDAVAGLNVQLQSFQSEQEGRVERLYAFTDAEGRFWAEVLPDATYCVYVNDVRWISEPVDLIPYRSASSEVTPPRLTAAKGERVEVRLTAGRERTPLPDRSVTMTSFHNFSWEENGKERRGRTGRSFWTTTDSSGRAVGYAAPGPLKVNVSGESWRIDRQTKVELDAENVVRVHREAGQPVDVSGQLVLADGLEASFDGAMIQTASIDGETQEEASTTADQEGRFSFASSASRFGVFAETKDGKAAGVATSTELDERIHVTLHPTEDYHGRLLDQQENPLAGRTVQAVIRIRGEARSNRPFVPSFEVKRLETETDQAGHYSFHHLPVKTVINLRVLAADGGRRGPSLGDISLTPGEERPLAIRHLDGRSKPAQTEKRPLAERFGRILRDCRLSGFHLMVIRPGPTDAAQEFAEDKLIDYAENEQVARFMQLQIAPGDQLPSDDAEFAASKGWPAVDSDEVFACVYERSGEELARITLPAGAASSEKQAAEFLEAHAPAVLDAAKKWDEAFAEAKKSGRKIWVRTSGRYCGPCFKLTRWLDRQRELLKKDYVLLKVDSFLDRNGGQVAERLTQGRQVGIPFHGIFDPGGELLIDSDGPVGNIGYPSSYEGKKHLREMLHQTRGRLTEAEVDELVASIGQ